VTSHPKNAHLSEAQRNRSAGVLPAVAKQFIFERRSNGSAQADFF
jgi:hypothetical protein